MLSFNTFTWSRLIEEIKDFMCPSCLKITIYLYSSSFVSFNKLINVIKINYLSYMIKFLTLLKIICYLSKKNNN